MTLEPAVVVLDVGAVGSELVGVDQAGQMGAAVGAAAVPEQLVEVALAPPAPVDQHVLESTSRPRWTLTWKSDHPAQARTSRRANRISARVTPR